MAIHLRSPSSGRAAAEAAERLRALRDGIKEHWHRIRMGLGSSGAPSIDSMESMYRAELHDLHSAEAQLCALADEIWVSIRNGPLAQRVSDYATELRTRAAESEKLIQQFRGSALQHPDEAMHALVRGASRMAESCTETVRDAALVAAMQRIVHYMIADYGTIAAHARALGRAAEALRFAAYADRDAAIDAELSLLAENTLNPQAAERPTKERLSH